MSCILLISTLITHYLPDSAHYLSFLVSTHRVCQLRCWPLYGPLCLIFLEAQECAHAPFAFYTLCFWSIPSPHVLGLFVHILHCLLHLHFCREGCFMWGPLRAHHTQYYLSRHVALCSQIQNFLASLGPPPCLCPLLFFDSCACFFFVIASAKFCISFIDSSSDLFLLLLSSFSFR